MAARVITLFWAPGMPDVEAARAWLSERGIAAKLRDVSSDAQALADLLLLAGAPTVPTLAATEEVAVGFDPARWDEIVSGGLPPGGKRDTSPEEAARDG